MRSSEKEGCDLRSLTEIMQQENIKKLQQHAGDQKHRRTFCSTQHRAAQFIHPADDRQLHRAVKRIFQQGEKKLQQHKTENADRPAHHGFRQAVSGIKGGGKNGNTGIFRILPHFRTNAL